MIFDAKSAWDLRTLHDHAHKGIDQDYYYQILGYNHLLGYNKGGYVFHGLVDTPAECNYGKEVLWEDLPFEQRWLHFNVVYDQEVINKVIKQVIKCRKYLEEYVVGLNKKIGVL